MGDVRFVGLSDDGGHLLLVDEDEQQHRLAIDDDLRAALRSGRPERATGGATAVRATSPAEPERPAARPRDVQSFLRSGMTIEEVAERSGWTVEKVTLFEPPIRAERDHVAFTAQNLTIAGRGSAPTTVGERVNERLEQRGVVIADVTWDAYRTERGWTIACRFPAGGRPRAATWRFDAPTRSVHPCDDEARWLSEDDNSAGDSPLPAGTRSASPDVYDVIAEGGLDSAARPRKEPVRPGRIPHATVRDDEESAETSTDTDESKAPEADDSPVDLVSVMRQRSRQRRSSRKKPAAAEPAKADAPAKGDEPTKDADADHVEEPAATLAKPTVDDLGHDPVTGTADLFGLDDVEHPDEVTPEADEPEATTPEETEPEQTAPEELSDEIPDRPSQARKGRPAVPSWDDIMFGKRPRS
ncbi:septation protein SepH [Calidifontibacter terrae]